MINRQKSLLCLLDYAGGNSSRLELVKWSFLLAKETNSEKREFYYDFTPYHYGPYSFTLQHEMGRLARDGFVQNYGDRRWIITDSGRRAIKGIPKHLQRDAEFIIDKYGDYGENSLLNSVYRRYPFFAIKSKRTIKNPPKMPPARDAIHTVGYEKQSIEIVLNKLLKAGIRIVFDVRRSPVARRYGFHKRTLAKLCDKIGINYQHFPELGIPSSLRKNLTTPSEYANLFNYYNKEVIPNNYETISFFSNIAPRKPSAILCMEANADMCHRSHVAAAVSDLTKLPIVHL